jgi:hypothetical protein
MTSTELREFANVVADAVSAKVESKLNVYIAGKEAQCVAHHDRTRDHGKTLYGNGTPGLKTEVEQLRMAIRVLCFIAGGTFLAVVGQLAVRLVNSIHLVQ